MKLKIVRFVAFNQAKDVAADIRGGWCAGITAMVSAAVGNPDLEGFPDRGQWIEKVAFESASKALARINSQLRNAETLQAMLGRYAQSNDVCAQLHTAAFDGRGCKVLLSVSGWVPLLGHLYTLAFSKWLANHVGYIIRGGNKLILFDPNYGLGLFNVEDSAPLTLAQVTTAVADLAGKFSKTAYYLSYTKAIAVVDEDSLQLRPSLDMENKIKELSEMSNFYKSRQKAPVQNPIDV